MKFEELNLSKELLKAVDDMGFEEPTPIQALAIPLAMAGKDIIGQAQTGTGKTAAFAIPILQKIDPRSKDVQALVLCPTRELAIQVAEECKVISKHIRNLYIIPVYGGQPIERQFIALKKGVQIVIGTPGRILDHINRGTLHLDTAKIVVMDEADEMLDMGFRDDIEEILEHVGEERQMMFFSATMPSAFLQLADRFMHDPESVRVVHRELTVPTIEQIYFEVSHRMKTDVLCRIVDIKNPKLSLVFCNTKRKVDELILELQSRGYQAEGLHGDLKQSQRDRVMAKYRAGQFDILVATDVAARGIDVDDVEIVFNYELPQDEEYYIHRIGRTGRAGRSGIAYSFVEGREIYKLMNIQKLTHVTIKYSPIPSVADVRESRVTSAIEAIKHTIEAGDLAKYHAHIESLINDSCTSLDLAAACFKLYWASQFNEELLNKDSSNKQIHEAPDSEMVQLFINAGRKDRISPKDIVGCIAGETGIAGKVIGAIRIFDEFSFVEVPNNYVEDILSAMQNIRLRGMEINIEIAKEKRESLDQDGEGEKRREPRREYNSSDRKPRFGSDRGRGDREHSGGERRDYSGSRERTGGERREYSGSRERSGEERRDYSGSRERTGGERREYSGSRERSGEKKYGDRGRSDDRRGGSDRYKGGERKRSYGGERSGDSSKRPEKRERTKKTDNE